MLEKRCQSSMSSFFPRREAIQQGHRIDGRLLSVNVLACTMVLRDSIYDPGELSSLYRFLYKMLIFRKCLTPKRDIMYM